jgi:hypothetical protein
MARIGKVSDKNLEKDETLPNVSGKMGSPGKD